MPNPPLSKAIAEETVKRVEDKLREGYRPQGLSGPGEGAIRAAARDAVAERWVGSVNTFISRMEPAKSLHGLEPDWSLYRAMRYQQPVPRQVLHHPVEIEPALMAPQGQGERILVIGDLHQDPRHEDRLAIMTWIARHASEKRFERIIQVGDWSSWDSVNQHDRNDTQKARYKPPISADMDNLVASHQHWRKGMAADYRPRQNLLLGNHEYRLERFENANPEAHQTFTVQRDQAFAQFGWQTRPYGELFYVNGVAFTHHPTNGAGRAYGGKTGPQRAANESTVPVVSGHTHRRQVHDSPKIGPIDVISMVEVGCAMPWGTVESYAAHGLTGWYWGICEMTVHSGLITDLSFISMLTIRSLYSGDGADIRAA